MVLTPGQQFLYENLKVVSSLTDTVDLCLYQPKCRLYIVKQIPAEDAGYYEMIAGIDHPNLAKVHFVVQDGQKYCAVREFIAGDCLTDLLDGGKTFDERRAVQIAYELCSGLSALHEKYIVHRDVNPNNIIISGDGVAKLIDYGIARSYKEYKSKDTVIMGTKGYAAPEQFGFTQSDARTDVYAIGVLLNVMICGKYPVDEIASGPCGRIIRKCIEIDSRRRYTDMKELMRDLQLKAGAKDRKIETNYSDGLADKIIAGIPGIRTGKWYIIVPAVVGYVLELYVMIVSYGLCQQDIPHYIINTIWLLFMFVIPLFCFHNFLNVWNRMPFSRTSTRKSQKILYYILGALSVLIGLLLIAAPGFKE